MRQTSRIVKTAAPCAAVLLAALWLLPVQAQEYMMNAPADPSATAPKELAVPFNHNDHNKKAKLTKCATCHHPLPGMKPAKGKKGAQPKGMERRCSDCHHERPAPTDRAASLMVVSHKVCQDCHKAQKRGPVTCSGCHKSDPQAQAAPLNLLPSGGLMPTLLPPPAAPAE
ncbi:cytochrome c3 family protein [Humidesulfovibrio idahonensis]